MFLVSRCSLLVSRQGTSNVRANVQQNNQKRETVIYKNKFLRIKKSIIFG